jgi:hypothetical protein
MGRNTAAQLFVVADLVRLCHKRNPHHAWVLGRAIQIELASRCVKPLNADVVVMKSTKDRI